MRFKKQCFLCVRLLIGILVFFYTSPVQAIDSRDLGAAVVMKGKDLAPLLNQSIDTIGVYRVEGERVVAVPFQIDAMQANQETGQFEYIVDGSFRKEDRTPAQEAHARLKAEDELVVMSGDFGPRAAPGIAALQDAVEICNAGKSEVRCVYAARGLSIKPETVSPYLTYQPDTDRITTARYETQFLARAALAQSELVLKNASVDKAANLIDRFKLRFFLDLRHFFNLKIEEEDVTAKVLGVKVGPIRVIRRLLTYQKLGPIRVTPKAVSDYVFYWDRIAIPSVIFSPFDPKRELKEGSMGFGGFDFSRAFYGASFYSEKNKTPVVLDGIMSAAETALVKDGVTWWGISGSQGHVLVKVVPDLVLTRAGLAIKLHYKDDGASQAPPERESGESMVGFGVNPHDLPKGRFVMTFHQIFPPKTFKPGQESRYFTMPRYTSRIYASPEVKQ